MQTMDQQITAAPRSAPRLVGPYRALVPGWVLGAAWVIAWMVVGAVAPEVDPAEPIGALDLVLSNLLLVGIMLTVAGLVGRSRLAGIGSLLGGGVFAVGSITCWVGGHVGTWIAVQFVAGLALMLLATVGLQDRSAT